MLAFSSLLSTSALGSCRRVLEELSDILPETLRGISSLWEFPRRDVEVGFAASRLLDLLPSFCLELDSLV